MAQYTIAGTSSHTHTMAGGGYLRVLCSSALDWWLTPAGEATEYSMGQVRAGGDVVGPFNTGDAVRLRCTPATASSSAVLSVNEVQV